MLFDYALPRRDELKEEGYIPYRAGKSVENAVWEAFTKPTFKWREEFISLNMMYKNLPVNVMARFLFGYCKYYVDNPQQFGNDINNIKFHIAVKLWKIGLSFSKGRAKAYFKLSSKLNFDKMFDVALTAVKNDDCKWQEVKERVLPKVVYDSVTGEKLTKDDKNYKRGRVSFYGTEEGTKNFEYLCKLAEDEQGSLL